MKSVLKSASFSYIGGLPKPYSLDCIIIEDEQICLDVHEKYETIEEFYKGCEGVIQVYSPKTGGEANEVVTDEKGEV